MADTLQSAPLLSTPAQHILEDDHLSKNASAGLRQLSDEQIYITYEIERTIAEIKKGMWSKVALQFPDEMLPDAPRVFEFLQSGLRKPLPSNSNQQTLSDFELARHLKSMEVDTEKRNVRTYILADTSYGACCVDEIASEHIGADVVVHYGRSCLSPTARLPVIYVFTERVLEIDFVIRAFVQTYLQRDSKIILMADVPYSSHVPKIEERLRHIGYTQIFSTKVVHNPSSALPNRTVPLEVVADPLKLREWELFHVAEPPEALLLTLSSRVSQIHIYPTASRVEPADKSVAISTARALGRRYGLITSVSTAPIFGILINTLSVRNYIHIVEHVKSQILAAGKKSYTFVVGKINAAKIANFGEVGAWVVIGCWESSLVESKEFWKPVLTPFELELALKGDDERIWTGEWRSDFESILNAGDITGHRTGASDNRAEGPTSNGGLTNGSKETIGDENGGADSEEESVAPEFDLRSGRYVSHSRPMQPTTRIPNGTTSDANGQGPRNALVKRAKGDLAIIGGEASPGAEFLRSKRTWKGLGSDFEIAYEDPDQATGSAIEVGLSGIARGYNSSDGGSRT